MSHDDSVDSTPVSIETTKGFAERGTKKDLSKAMAKSDTTSAIKIISSRPVKRRRQSGRKLVFSLKVYLYNNFCFSPSCQSIILNILVFASTLRFKTFPFSSSSRRTKVCKKMDFSEIFFTIKARDITETVTEIARNERNDYLNFDLNFLRMKIPWAF